MPNKNLVSLSKIRNFSDNDKFDFPLAKLDLKYPPELAVFQNLFWQLRHETAPSDDLLKILFLFSPKVRLTENGLDEKTEFRLTAKEYSELTGIKLESSYSALSKVVETLYQHSVIFFHAEKKRSIRTRLISTCSYSNGCFYVAFTHFALYVMSVFNRENPFTKFTLKSVVSMSGHGLKLYPFLVQNQFRGTFDVSIVDLKHALGLAETAYPEYRDFKKSILKPHLDAINEKTELSVQFSAVKKNGRKASHVNFIVSTKKTVKTETVEEIKQIKQVDEKKISAKEVYSQLIQLKLLERFKESGESTEELLERIKYGFKNGQDQHWISKLEEFGAVFE
jgi:plasmid replication initiation protein